MRARILTFLVAAATLAALGATRAPAQQMADPDFDASVQAPAFVREHPRVVLDEAHHKIRHEPARQR